MTTAAPDRLGSQVGYLFRGDGRFRRLWISNLCFFAGVWMQTLVLGWLVFDITNSESLLALFTAVRLAPMFLGPLSGVLADRLDRVRFMLATVVWATLAITATAALVSAGSIGYWGIVAGGFAIGLA